MKKTIFFSIIVSFIAVTLPAQSLEFQKSPEKNISSEIVRFGNAYYYYDLQLEHAPNRS
jgi:hypothetical protein